MRDNIDCHCMLITGFIEAVVQGLWSVLECGSDGQPMIRPSPIPVETIDRTAHKVCNSY